MLGRWHGHGPPADCRSLARVSDNGVRSMPRSPSALRRTASSEVMTSITAGVRPPVRIRPARRAPSRASQTGVERIARVAVQEARRPLQQLALREQGRSDQLVRPRAGGRRPAAARDGRAQVVDVERAQPVRPAAQQAHRRAGRVAQQRPPAGRVGPQEQRGADDGRRDPGAGHEAFRLALGTEVAVRRVRIGPQRADEHDVAHPGGPGGLDQHPRRVDVGAPIVGRPRLEQDAGQVHHAVDAAQRRAQAVGLVVADHRGRDARRTRQVGHRRLASHHGDDAQPVRAGEPRQQRPADGAVGAGDRYLSAIHVSR